MALIAYPDQLAASGDAQKSVESFESEHGRPSLLRRMCAGYPAARGALDAMYHPIIVGGELPRRLKEMLFVVSAHARGCPYCAGGHSRFLVQEFGFDRDEVVALRDGNQATDAVTPAEQAAIDFVRKVSTEPHKTMPDDVRKLADHGYSEADVLEITTVAAVAGFTTTIASALHLEDDLEQFEMHDYF